MPRLPPTHWREKRLLGKKLNAAAERMRREIEREYSSNSLFASKLEDLRAKTSVAPDLKTYKHLISHYAIYVGDIDRAAQLIDEMESYGIGVHGDIFGLIFRAFEIHGGYPYTQWTRRRLENTWLAFVEALDTNEARMAEAAAEATVDKSVTEPPMQFPNAHSETDTPSFETVESSQPQDAYYSIEDSSREVNYQRVIEPDSSDKLGRWNDKSSIPSGTNDFFSPNEALESTIHHHHHQPEFADFDQPLNGVSPSKTVYLAPAICKVTGLAFAKCTSFGRTVEVWADIKRRWVPDVVEDVAIVEAEIAACYPENEQLFVEAVHREMSKSSRW